MTNEQILVVPRKDLFTGGVFLNGFGTEDLTGIIARINQFGYFIDRWQAENDPSLKQIIPYLMLFNQNKIFLFQRHSTQNETRLHQKYSIGVGGHINPTSQMTNYDIRDIIQKNLERELHEELEVSCSYQYQLIGYLNDDTNQVGQVHFGLIYRVDVMSEKEIVVKEKDLMTGGFVEVARLSEYYPQMESWSQILTKDLFLQKISQEPGIGPLFP